MHTTIHVYKSFIHKQDSTAGKLMLIIVISGTFVNTIIIISYCHICLFSVGLIILSLPLWRP